MRDAETFRGDSVFPSEACETTLAWCAAEERSRSEEAVVGVVKFWDEVEAEDGASCWDCVKLADSWCEPVGPRRALAVP